MKVKVLVELEVESESGSSLGLRTKKDLVHYFASCIGFPIGTCDVVYPIRDGKKNEKEYY